MDSKKHGAISYQRGWCRCTTCTQAAGKLVNNWRQMRADTATYATADEVRLWVESMGLTVHRTFKGRTAEILIERYNREHPDRPYVRVSERDAS